jgi:hypothetical protein
MIPEQRDCAALDQAAHRVDHKAWVGPIADQIAKENDAVDLIPAGMRETGFESLAVGVNIGEQGNQQSRATSSTHRARSRPSSKQA